MSHVFSTSSCAPCSEASKITEIADKVDQMYRAMFIGNGKQSLLTRIELLENIQARTTGGLMIVLRDVVLPAGMMITGILIGKFIK